MSAAGPMWWLSFVDPDAPDGAKFLGVAIIRAKEFIDAVVISKMLGINPGGEVAGLPVPDDQLDLCAPNVDKLLSRDELRKRGLL